MDVFDGLVCEMSIWKVVYEVLCCCWSLNVSSHPKVERHLNHEQLYYFG